MSDERTYGDAEAEAIFDLAVRGEQPTPWPTSGGLTLRQLQAIGQQVGIDPEQISEAARALDLRGRVLPRRMSVGMPVSVGRVVPLARPLTGPEWQSLVAELRDVFRATGEVDARGSAREWSNGNLKVLEEPTASGHQVRLTTTNARLMRLNWYGLALLSTAMVFLVVLLPDVLADGAWDLRTLFALLPTLLVAGVGGGTLAYNRLTLPKWAQERKEQMEAIADSVRTLTADPGSKDAST